MHTELVEALEDVLLQFDSCTIRQDNLKTKIRNLINKATKESDNAK
jgi:allophanate hydrolase subunit 1